jgi:short subunit dehydrogenase-like uncharacterized protein
MPTTANRLDIIIYGATGFTGQLAVEYLRNSYPSLRFGIAGRNKAKLEQIAPGFPEDRIIIANSDDMASIDIMTSKAKVLLTFAGPYAKYGSSVVDSCIRSKTHYCDITGEVPWIRKMIDAYDTQAKGVGIKIVNCCGFDSVPSDAGNFFIIQNLQKRGIEPLEVCMIMGDSKGGASGGTIASAFNVVASSTLAELKALADPFFICPRDTVSGKVIVHPDPRKSADCKSPGYDSIFNTYTAPWLMQAINTRVVNRSNALNGINSVYYERLAVKGPIVAALISLVMPIVGILIFFSWTRNLLMIFLPKPSEGPSFEERENGFFRMKFWGKGKDASGREVVVKGALDAFEGDPGYKQTAKMACETALCLLDKNINKKSGIMTPVVATDGLLIDRLNKVGVKFYMLDEDKN